MTTGRINQVTILVPQGSSPPDGETRPATVGQKARVVKRLERNESTRLWKIHPVKGLTPKAIQLPPLSSPKDGPPQGSFGHEGVYTL